LIRRVLLKVLLIAVFVNAAIGVPLHAAVHLGAGGVAQAHSFGAGEPASDDHGEDDDDRAHASCAWCLAHAEASGVPPAVPGALSRGDWHVPHARPTTAIAPVFSAGLWSSSPRGPPPI